MKRNLNRFLKTNVRNSLKKLRRQAAATNNRQIAQERYYFPFT